MVRFVIADKFVVKAKIKLSIHLLLVLSITYNELLNELRIFGLAHTFMGKSYAPALFCIKSNESALNKSVDIVLKEHFGK
jgi:hypothetical protein